MSPYDSTIKRRQQVIAVPPVATSILEGPYLPPANAENELFVGPHGVPSPLHHGYPMFPGAHTYYPHYPNPTFPSYYAHPTYHPIIPWGLRHGYHTHWPHMQASGPVFLADPNDGMYQEPVTGTLIPRPVIPPQYPGFVNHAVDFHGYHHPGAMFLGGHGPRFYRKSPCEHCLFRTTLQIIYTKMTKIHLQYSLYSSLL